MADIRPFAYRINSALSRRLGLRYDRRVKFNDISNPRDRCLAQCSPIIQFYSSVDNIGNYLPVLGIREMLGYTPDVWCMHNTAIDFDYINSAYQCAIIGGAGLLDRGFKAFWELLAERCQIPMIIWGIGGCYPDRHISHSTDYETVRKVASRCDLIDVRDGYTAQRYNLDRAHVSPCPSIVYLQGHFKTDACSQTKTLLVTHDELTGELETASFRQTLFESHWKFSCIDNVQRPHWGLRDIIRHDYLKSGLVITVRLHGAIIAFALRIPYIAICRDEKMRAFCEQYGNGMAVESLAELESVRANFPSLKSIDSHLESSLEFGQRARDWFESICGTVTTFG